MSSAFVIVVVLAATRFGIAGATAGSLAAAGAAAWVDARTGRLPNPLVGLVAFAAVIGVVAAAADRGVPQAVLAASAGLLGCATPLLAVHLAVPDAIGFGDVKLAAALGVAIGLVDPRLGLVALCLASGVTALHGLVRRRGVVPLGPGLVLGAVAAVALGGRVWE